MKRTILIIVAVVIILGGLGYLAHSLDLIGMIRKLHGG